MQLAATPTKSLSQLNLSISIDARAALERVRRLIETAPFSDPTLVAVESDLLDILDAVAEAVALQAAVVGAFVGPLPSPERKKER